MCLRIPVPSRPAVARRLTVAFALMAIATMGCKPTPGVSRYTAPHEASESDIPVDPPEDPSAGERIVGIIAPDPIAKDQWWFFKMRGRPGAVGKRVKDLESFAASLKLPAGDEKLPTYDLPKGWEVTRARAEFVLFSIRTGHPYTPNNLDVSRVGGTLAMNVNRWREQVGLKELPEADVPASIKSIKLADGNPAYSVDLTGPGGGGKMPPFAR